MQHDRFTLMLIPDAHSNVRRLQVRRRTLYWAVCGGLLIFSLLSLFFVHYSYVLSQVFVADALQQDNVVLREQIQALNEAVEEADARLQDIRRFEEKHRSITDLNDEGRALSMGLVVHSDGSTGSEQGDTIGVEGADLQLFHLGTAILNSRLMGLPTEIDNQIKDVGDLVDFIQTQSALLANTPSIWPVKGWVTSPFGPRNDPFNPLSGDQVMHLGTDIAAPHGAAVNAPAGALVVFTGERGVHGQTIVLDHGFGLATHYSHLSSILVKPGDRVTRDQQIGSVGTTGQSTGPHLHYEIRQYGIPVHPRRFVLQ